MKECRKCFTFKKLDGFNKNRNNPDGLSSYCRECTKAIWKAGNYKNEKQKLKSYRYKEVLGGCCQKCNYSVFYSLHYHHVIPARKNGSVALLIRSGAKDFEVLRELDKCALLCANCHQEFECGYWTGEFVKRNGKTGYTLDKSTIRYNRDEIIEKGKTASNEWFHQASLL